MNPDIHHRDASCIFIVDDDWEDVELLRRAFHELSGSYLVHHFRNGEELMQNLNACLEERISALPDLIILDLNMPVLDGREALLEIKKDRRLSKIPVIVFTSSHSVDDVESTYGLGANSFISKPTSLSGFLDIAKSVEDYWLKLVRLPHPH